MEEEEKTASLALAVVAVGAVAAAEPPLGRDRSFDWEVMEVAEAGVDLVLAVALAVALAVMPRG
jgi:hypothetical protein